MAGATARRGGGVALKLAAMMIACVLLFLVAGCGVDGAASAEAHPHQGKVKVGWEGSRRETAEGGRETEAERILREWLELSSVGTSS